MTAPKPATPLPTLAVDWKDASVSLYTLGHLPHDCVLATSKDSSKGKTFEAIVAACNSYPKLIEDRRRLVEALRHTMNALAALESGGGHAAAKLPINSACAFYNDARALLAEIGEAD